LIDFAAFLDGSPATTLATAQAISHAFQTSGFLYLQNHGIPPDIISTVFEKSAEFFRRPQHEKDALSWTTAESNRGYVMPGREKVTQSSDPDEIAKLRASNPDLKETMEIGRDGVPGQQNQWPDKFDAQGEEFTKTMRVFFDMCKDLHIEVMRAIALGMGLDVHFFDSFTDRGDNTLRLLHYPPVPKSVFRNNPGQVRAGEHHSALPRQRGGPRGTKPQGDLRAGHTNREHHRRQRRGSAESVEQRRDQIDEAPSCPATRQTGRGERDVPGEVQRCVLLQPQL
jgi:isopenicillin N synthase-like dioxygenase